MKSLSVDFQRDDLVLFNKPHGKGPDDRVGDPRKRVEVGVRDPEHLRQSLSQSLLVEAPQLEEAGPDMTTKDKLRCEGAMELPFSQLAGLNQNLAQPSRHRLPNIGMGRAESRKGRLGSVHTRCKAWCAISPK